MPFKSQAQRKFMYAKHPEMAKRWEEHTPKGTKLPKKKRSTMKKRALTENGDPKPRMKLPAQSATPTLPLMKPNPEALLSVGGKSNNVAPNTKPLPNQVNNMPLPASKSAQDAKIAQKRPVAQSEPPDSPATKFGPLEGKVASAPVILFLSMKSAMQKFSSPTGDMVTPQLYPDIEPTNYEEMFNPTASTDKSVGGPSLIEKEYAGTFNSGLGKEHGPYSGEATGKANPATPYLGATFGKYGPQHIRKDPHATEPYLGSTFGKFGPQHIRKDPHGVATTHKKYDWESDFSNPFETNDEPPLSTTSPGEAGFGRDTPMGGANVPTTPNPMGMGGVGTSTTPKLPHEQFPFLTESTDSSEIPDEFNLPDVPDPLDTQVPPPATHGMPELPDMPEQPPAMPKPRMDMPAIQPSTPKLPAANNPGNPGMPPAPQPNRPVVPPPQPNKPVVPPQPQPAMPAKQPGMDKVFPGSQPAYPGFYNPQDRVPMNQLAPKAQFTPMQQQRMGKQMFTPPPMGLPKPPGGMPAGPMGPNKRLMPKGASYIAVRRALQSFER